MNRLITCPCGAIELELRGEPRACLYCHCDDCQLVHSAAYVPVVVYANTAVRVTRGVPLQWKLKTNLRTSCSQCGTRLFAEPAKAPIRTVMAQLLPPEVFKPSFHIFCDFARLPVRDGLPHFRGLPQAMGGGDECVDW